MKNFVETHNEFYDNIGFVTDALKQINILKQPLNAWTISSQLQAFALQTYYQIPAMNSSPIHQVAIPLANANSTSSSNDLPRDKPALPSALTTTSLQNSSDFKDPNNGIIPTNLPVLPVKPQPQTSRCCGLF